VDQYQWRRRVDHSSGLRLRTMDDILGHMFRRHRSDPDPTTVLAFRTRLEAIALTARSETNEFDPRRLRGRLARPTSVGLRDRLGRAALAAPRA
jgi:hypothetical protein